MIDGKSYKILGNELKGEVYLAELCRREGISESVYYRWSKEFLEAGKQDGFLELVRWIALVVSFQSL